MASLTSQYLLTLVNGEPATVLDSRDRGLAYGHGVFETMRVHRGEIPLWAMHADRLAEGLAVLGIEPPADRVEKDIEKALGEMPAEGTLKLTVTAGAADRGYRMSRPSRPTVLLQCGPVPARPGPVTLQVCDYRLPDNPVLAGIKHLNRLDQVVAAAKLADGCEGLMLDTRGNVIEALSHNVFVRSGSVWRTPSLRRCGVKGVMRRLLMESVLPEVAARVEEGDISLTEAAASDELFICNAVAGVRRVASILGKRTWPEPDGVSAPIVLLEGKYPCFAA